MTSDEVLASVARASGRVSRRGSWVLTFYDVADGLVRLGRMRGLRTDGAAQAIITGLVFTQNVCRGRYELGTEAARPLRVATAFGELAQAI